jgi:CRP-like cAMP-binding protein/thioredoxin reductase/Fe-S-cluster-containing dehydrogenase component
MHGIAVDLAIVGAGPAGLAAAARAAFHGLRYVVLERSDHLADTIYCYQKNKLVMAEPALVPKRSELPFEAGTREQLLEMWQRFLEKQRLQVHFRQEVSRIERKGELFDLLTSSGNLYQAARVVVAVGTQGNPRKLGVPGENLPQVADRLVDPDAYSGEDIVVVGAGDSALEVALGLAARNRVHLVVRTAEIVRAKDSLVRDVLLKQASGAILIHYSSKVRAVGEGFVDLEGPSDEVRLAADRVFVKAGADPPRSLLERWGIQFSGPARDARPRLGPGFESPTMPGLFLIGAVTGRDLIKLGINQGYEVVEAILGHRAEPADEAILKERLPFWNGSAEQRIATLRDAVPLLAAAEEDQLREILLTAEASAPRRGEVILRQNDYTDSLILVTDGSVTISRVDESGTERKFTDLEAGNFFGEMGLLSGRRRNATVKAGEGARLLEIPRKAMLKLLHLSPPVKAHVDRVFLIRALRNFLFPDLPDAVLWRLAAKASLQRFERQQPIFSEGDPSDAFYLLRSGMVKVSRRSGDREIVLNYLVAGNYFGESALLEKGQRQATVSTIFPTELIVLRRDDFNSFLDAHPDLRRRLLDALGKKEAASLSREVMQFGEVLSQLIESEAVIGTDVLLIDNHKCVRCGNCIAACENVHDDGQARLSLVGTTVVNLLLPNSCMQCENPLCMLDCPPDAIVRRPEGEIFIKDSCIGCGNCARNCPYDNIFMVQPKRSPDPFGWLLGLFSEQKPKPKQEVAVKCDLCRDLAGGPACVRSCPTGAAIRLEPKDPDDLRKTIEELVQPGALL